MPLDVAAYPVMRDAFGPALDDVDANKRAGLWRRIRAEHEAWPAA